MNKLTLSSLLFIVLLLVGCSDESSNGVDAKSIRNAGILRVASFNIRNSAANDGDNSWLKRKELVAQTIREQKMMILGLQEALPDQVEYLSNNLPQYEWCGLPREDGKSKGEYAPIFYLKNRFRLLADSTLWLSETPHLPGSVSWGAACTRIATWARMEDLKSGIRFYFVNTHFDHESELARNESAKLLLNFVKEKAMADPVIVTGDFNMVEQDEAYKTLVHSWKGYAPLHDVAKRAIELSGPDYTFQAFDEECRERAKIDFLFVNDFFKAGKQEVLRVKRGGLYVSDHYPLVADLSFCVPQKPNLEKGECLKQTLYPPYLVKEKQLFADSTLVDLKAWNQEAGIYYTMDGTEPTENSLLFAKPFWLTKSTVVTARTYKEGFEKSRTVQFQFTHAHLSGSEGAEPKIQHQTPLTSRFKGGGSEGLLDGKRGSLSFQDGKWQGYEGNDLEFTVDLGKGHHVKRISLGCLQAQRDWIFLPQAVQFLISPDGKNFELFTTQEINSSLPNEKIEVRDISAECGGKDFRFLKVIAKNQGKCPQWHSGAGGKAWLFVDELVLALD
ncbi:MAG: FN3 associated domain-containing protein [Marinifilaceae bacterium]